MVITACVMGTGVSLICEAWERIEKQTNSNPSSKVLSSNGDLTAVLKVKHGFDNNFNNDNR